MNPQSDYGMAIGNLTAQAGSNLNLNDFDNYVVKDLKLTNYVRYVDDIVIVSDDKKELITKLPIIIEKLKETNQTLNKKKTRIETAYHGVPFLGKVSYPYGYQKTKKTTIIRIYEKAKNIKYESAENLLAMTNSQIGTLKKYNCRKLILNYSRIIKNKMPKTIIFNEEKLKFEYAK